MLPFLGFTVCLTVLQSNRKKNKVNKNSGIAKHYFSKADLCCVSRLPGILPVTDGKSVMVVIFCPRRRYHSVAVQPKKRWLSVHCKHINVKPSILVTGGQRNTADVLVTFSFFVIVFL